MRLSSWLRSLRSRLLSSGPEAGHQPARPRKRPGARLSIDFLEDRTVPSTFLVQNLSDDGAGSLRAAVAGANANPGADVIRFAPAARDGTITLTNGQLLLEDDVWIDGPGARRLAVSGHDSSRVFQIATGVTATIDDLTITRGNASLRGGGIRNDGTLTLSRAVVSDNRVTGVPGLGSGVDGMGGGIYNTGNLAVYHTRFEGNRSAGGDGVPGVPSSAGLGGAIMSLGSAAVPAAVVVRHSTFVDNPATGGAAGAGPFARNGLGGAVMNDAGTFDIAHSLFHNNRAVGGSSAITVGGGGSGGAVMNAAKDGDAILSVRYSTFTGNRAVGGAGGAGGLAQVGRGGAIGNFIPPFLPGSVTVRAVVTVEHSTILGNQAVGGAGMTAGNGQGGGLANENRGSLTVSHSLIAGNQAVGGASAGGAAGKGLGGGVFNGGPTQFDAPTLTLERSVIALNKAEGGVATGGGTAGQGIGGGVYVAPGGIASADPWTFILWNDASTSDDDVFGVLWFI